MKNQDERIKRRLAEYVAEQKQLDESGSDPGAHLRWALSKSVLAALEAGHQITDLDCFRQDPRYTGPIQSETGADIGVSEDDGERADWRDDFRQFCRRQDAGGNDHHIGGAAN